MLIFLYKELRNQFVMIQLIFFENLFKPRQLRFAVYMLLTSSVLFTTSKQCFELTSSVLSTTSKQCFELTSSVLSTTSKQCFELSTASFLVCSLIFIEYNHKKVSNQMTGNFFIVYFGKLRT